MVLLAAVGCGTVIHGVVRDKPTGNPISSASVSIQNQNATTNAVGVFKLSADLEPSSVLVVNAPGYFMYSASVAKRGDEGDEIVRDVELVPRSQIAPR